MNNDKLYTTDGNTALALHTPNPASVKEALKTLSTNTVSETQESAENDPLSWQTECGEKIKNEHNVILSSPTGSGKTRVFLEWANNHKKEAEAEGKRHTVYITAPIKALSNQRFRELQEQGYNVGLETGDIKDVPEDADYICCTQEIYTNKYINDENATLVMDEFHYIFESHERARTYVDALHSTKAQNILLASATFGDTQEFQNYVNRTSKRDFYNYANDKRITSLEYEGKINSDEISDSLVVTFSASNCRRIAGRLAQYRDVDDDTLLTIHKFADKMKIDNGGLLNCCGGGVAFYYGAMLPKEKLFVEQLFEQRLIDTVVGTDALALGVNFPVQKVVFTQLAKYHEGPISKNLFEQLAGRAGRKGYYDKGEVYYCDSFGVESFYYETDQLFEQLKVAKNENASVVLDPNIKDILLGKTSIDEEVSFINTYSTVDRNEDYLRQDIEKTIDTIQNYHVCDSEWVGDEAEFDEFAYFRDCVDADEFCYEDEDGESYNYDEEESEYIVFSKIRDFSDASTQLDELRTEAEKDDASPDAIAAYEEAKESFDAEYARFIKKAKILRAIDGVFESGNPVTEEQIEALEALYDGDEYLEYSVANYRNHNTPEYKEHKEYEERLTQEFQENIPYAYFSEYDAKMNCALFAEIVNGTNIDRLMDVAETESFMGLLQLRKYIRQLPKKYRAGLNISKLDATINDIDDTALSSGRISLKEFQKVNGQTGE